MIQDDYYNNPVRFFTATILEWKPLLINDIYKDIIINSLKFLVKDKRIVLYGFVIMPNHIHLVWRLGENRKKSDVQRDFLKYTGQQIKFGLQKNHPDLLKEFYVGAKDREYQIWERNAFSSNMPSEEVIAQKINYIHYNPTRGRWNLVKEPTEYKYSSAEFYYNDYDRWDMLTYYNQV